MNSSEFRRPLSPGDPAPDFTLPAIDGNGLLSLADFREKTPVFLALFVGLWCPFCRRSIAHMAAADPKLKAIGVETLGVVATQPENARLYFKFRPNRLRLAADPELSTHRAYGLPKPDTTPELIEAIATLRINPTGELSEPLPVREAAEAIGKLDGYVETDIDRVEVEHQWPQLKGQFLIDRNGIVRWANIECGTEGLAGIGKFPSTEEILQAAQSLGRMH